MGWRAWILSAWPGLPRLWLRGEWIALLLAAGFAGLLNVAILATFVWPQWMGPGFLAVVWPCLGLVWAGSLWSTWQQRHELFGESAVERGLGIGGDGIAVDRLFIEAQGEYLRGNWESARLLLHRQLARYPRDAAGRLLLATLFRRMGELDQAAWQLDWLERLDQAVPWSCEIRRERELLARDRAEVAETAGNANPGGLEQKLHGMETAAPQRAA